MARFNIIRLTRNVEVFENTVKPADYEKRFARRERIPKEDYGSVLAKGTLMSEWHDSGRIRGDGMKAPRAFTEEPDGRQGYHRQIPTDAFEVVDPLNPQWADFDFLHRAMMYGAFPIPNLEVVWSDDPEGMTKLISAIAAGGGSGATGVGHVILTPPEGADLRQYEHTRWARAFPHYTQGGNMNGSGYILLYDVSYGKRRVPIAGRYALCKHEYVDLSTPERKQRGDHRGYCSKCGLNMSVDSSD